MSEIEGNALYTQVANIFTIKVNIDCNDNKKAVRFICHFTFTG